MPQLLYFKTAFLNLGVEHYFLIKYRNNFNAQIELQHLHYGKLFSKVEKRNLKVAIIVCK